MHAGGIVLGDEREVGIDEEGLPAPYIPDEEPGPWDYPYPPPAFIDGHTLDWDNTPFEEDPYFLKVDRQDAQPPLPAQEILPTKRAQSFIHHEIYPRKPRLRSRLLVTVDFALIIGILIVTTEKFYRFVRGYIKMRSFHFRKLTRNFIRRMINTIRLSPEYHLAFGELRDVTIKPELKIQPEFPNSHQRYLEMFHRVAKLHYFVQLNVDKKSSIRRLRKFLFYFTLKRGRKTRYGTKVRLAGVFSFPVRLLRKMRSRLSFSLSFSPRRPLIWILFRITMRGALQRGVLYGGLAGVSYYTVFWMLDKFTSWIFHPKLDDKTLYKARNKHIKEEIATLSIHNALTTDLEAYIQRADFYKQGNQVLSWLATHVSSIFNDPHFTFRPTGWNTFLDEEWRRLQLKKRDFMEWCDRNRKVFIVIGLGIAMLWIRHPYPTPWKKRVRYLAPFTIVVLGFFYGTKWPSPNTFKRPPRVPYLGQHESDYKGFRFVPFLKQLRSVAHSRLSFLNVNRGHPSKDLSSLPRS